MNFDLLVKLNTAHQRGDVSAVKTLIRENQEQVYTDCLHFLTITPESVAGDLAFFQWLCTQPLELTDYKSVMRWEMLKDIVRNEADKKPDCPVEEVSGKETETNNRIFWGA